MCTYFFKTHEYPTDVTPLQRDIFKTVMTRVKQEAQGLPVLYTEWNAGLVEYGAGSIFYQDTHYPAAFVIKNVADVQGLVDIFSYWTFTDIFEEQGMISTPYHGGFGMMNIYGVRKAVWRAFELLHQAGDIRVQVNYPTATNLTVDVLALKKAQQVMVFVTNIDVVTNPIEKQLVLVQIPVAAGMVREAVVTQIDENNANSYTAWLELDKPQYPTREQNDYMNKKSQLQYTQVTCKMNSSTQTCDFQVAVQTYGTVVLSFKLV